MFELDQEILEAYNSLHEWSREDLCGKGACWQYSGNHVLGWNWVADGNHYKRLNFGTNLEIPSNPLVYLDVSHGLIYEHNDSIEIDFQRHDNHYYFIIRKPEVGDVETIVGKGLTKLLASIDLYRNVCDYYLKTKMPSVTSLDCVDNLFTDTDGHIALDMTTSYAASVLFDSFNHFIIAKYHTELQDRELELEHGIIKFVEGDVRIYSKYGVKEKPKPNPERDSLLLSTLAGTFNVSGITAGWQMTPDLTGTVTVSDGQGSTYTIQGKPVPQHLAEVVWKKEDIN